MRIEHVLAGVIIVLCLISFLRHVNRSDADKTKPSWAVRAINAAGGNVEATRLIPATGELIGRGTVAAAGVAGDAGRAKAADLKAKVAEAKERRAEAREARTDRAAEIANKATATAVQKGRAVVETVERRWNKRDGDRPLIDRRGPGKADAGQPVSDGDTPITDPPTRMAWQRIAARLGGYCTEGKCTGNGTIVRITPDSAIKTPCPTCNPDPKPDADGPQLADVADVDAWRKQLREARQAGANDQQQDGPAAGTDTAQEDSVTATDERTIPATATAPGDATAASGPTSIPMPVDWRTVASRVADLNPESDADLINFMSSEIAGMCGYSDAYEQLFETCTNSLGLDPRSVAGLGEFGERVVDLTREMALAHKRFIVIYAEVMKMVADGTQMPHNGRFFSGDVAV
jgi:hypothetical protein